MAVMEVSAILLLLHGAVGAYDGIFLHDRKYSLHTLPEARREHLAHTLRAVLMMPIAWLLFISNTGGWLLWLAVLVILADLSVQVWDAHLEGSSRQDFGGLSTMEYQVHLLSTLFYGGALAVAFVSKPFAAWGLSSTLFLEPTHSTLVAGIGWLMFAGAGIGSLHHIWQFSSNRDSSTVDSG